MITGKPLKLIQWLYNQDKDKKFEIKEYKEQRNKKQNAKYWTLLNELALTLKISVEELHFNLLKYYSQRYEICVPADYKLRGIDYYEKKSTKIINGKKFIVYHVFVPSHELNTREFSQLLYGLCCECSQQGIETLSPEELEKLKSNLE